MFNLANYMNPALLWLALGALAPIIIHLMARSRPKPTPFPAVRFILASHRRSSAKFKLKQLLLLLLRIAVLAAFALVVARPWVKGAVAETRRATAAVTAVILLDTSYSMGCVQGSPAAAEKPRSALDKAREMAVAAADSFTMGESRACLLLVNDSPQPVIADFDHAYDLNALKQQLSAAPLAPRGTNCSLALRQAIRMLKEVTGVRKSIFLFTDLTERAWPAPVPPDPGKDDITIYVADAGPDKPLNPAILSASGPAQVAPGIQFEVKARVDAVGSAGRQVEFIIDGERKGRKPASAHQVELVSLVTSAEKLAPEHWGAVSLTGRDDLPIDNSAYFTFRAAPALNVLLVNGAPSTLRWRDELDFLRTALAPRGIATEQLIQVAETKPKDLEALEQLPRCDVIALCNVATLSTAAWTRIRHFVSTGHGLIVFPGDNLTPAAYGPVAKGDAALLPCSFLETIRPTEPARLEPGKLKHPILAAFQGGRNGDLAAAKFNTYLKLKPNDKLPHDIVLAFRNDDPALIEGRYGAGRVLVFASTCDLDWNTLPQELPYVPLMHESFRFLSSAEREQRDVLVGAAPALRIPSPDKVRALTLTRLIGPAESPGDKEPRGAERAREDVKSRMDERSGQLNLAPLEKPGVYRVEITRDARKNPDELLFAVNLDTAESNLARIQRPEETLKSLLPGRNVKLAHSTVELLDQISRTESVSEMTSHLAGICLAILIGEMYLSNRMRVRVKSVSEDEEEG